MFFGVHLDRKTSHWLSCTAAAAGCVEQTSCEHWNLHNYFTQGFVSLLQCQLLRLEFGSTLQPFLRCHQIPGTESTGASPLQGPVCWWRSQRAMTHFANELHFQPEVMVRVRVSLYLAPYKKSRAKPLPPRAYSVKNKLQNQGKGPRGGKHQWAESFTCSVFCVLTKNRENTNSGPFSALVRPWTHPWVIQLR